MSMHYYSRARFTYQFLPLLRASKLPAHVIWIYAAGMETKLITDDLSLRKPGNFSFDGARSHCTYMTTAFMESLAKQNLGKLSLVNIFPGLVVTPGFNNPAYPLWFKVTWRVLGPLVTWFMAITPEEAGQRMLFLATERFPPGPKSGTDTERTNVATGTDGSSGSGAYACENHSESTSAAKRAKAYSSTGLRREEVNKLCWEHTMDVFDTVAAGKMFSE